MRSPAGARWTCRDFTPPLEGDESASVLAGNALQVSGVSSARLGLGGGEGKMRERRTDDLFQKSVSASAAAQR